MAPALRALVGPALHSPESVSDAASRCCLFPRCHRRTPPSSDDIAIIAVAGRYPGADTPEAFWEALSEGRDLVTEVPPERWDIEAIYADGQGRARQELLPLGRVPE